MAALSATTATATTAPTTTTRAMAATIIQVRADLDRRDRKSTRLNSSHTVIYTLSLHDALPIYGRAVCNHRDRHDRAHDDHQGDGGDDYPGPRRPGSPRSEEHTSELQSHSDLHSFPTRRSSDLWPRCLQPPRPPRPRPRRPPGRWRRRLSRSAPTWIAEIGRASCRERV